VTESLRNAAGRKVVSRASAQPLGVVDRFVVSADCQRVAAVVIGRGKKAQLVDWSDLSGFGADAVMVSDESALRPPGDEREQQAAQGKLELVGRRVLADSGTAVGVVDDVIFDPGTGAVTTVSVDGRAVPADSVLGAGSYAVVVAAEPGPG
jgi:uncharacterized protein YrrD